MGLTTFANGFTCYDGSIHITHQPRFKIWLMEQFEKNGINDNWDLMIQQWMNGVSSNDLPEMEEDMETVDFNRLAFNKIWDDKGDNEFWVITGDTTGRMKIILTCVFGVPIYFDDTDEIFDLDMALPVEEEDYFLRNRRPFYAYVDRNSMEHIMDCIKRIERNGDDMRENYNEYLVKVWNNDDTIRNLMKTMYIGEDRHKMRMDKYMERIGA